MQKRETKAINKLCVREILSLSLVCGAYFFVFRGRNLLCFGIAYNFDVNSRRKQGIPVMHTAFFTRVCKTRTASRPQAARLISPCKSRTATRSQAARLRNKPRVKLEPRLGPRPRG